MFVPGVEGTGLLIPVEACAGLLDELIAKTLFFSSRGVLLIFTCVSIFPLGWFPVLVPRSALQSRECP